MSLPTFRPIPEVPQCCNHCGHHDSDHLPPKQWCLCVELADALEAAQALVALCDDQMPYCWMCRRNSGPHADGCAYVALRRRILGQPEEAQS